MSAARFWELSVEAPEEVSEGLTNFAWELGALGVVEEEIAGVPRLRAFFAGATSVDTLVARVRTYLEGLRALGFTVRDDARLAPLADPGWAEAWRDHFRPRPVGDRLLIAPPWDAPSVPGRLTIVIEPGRAFGTGHHGSTAGCLEMLERIAERERPACALDLGTGSGILAIAAARLGIAHVLAIDDDPDAVANARANVALNGVGTCGDLHAGRRGHAGGGARASRPRQHPGHGPRATRPRVPRPGGARGLPRAGRHPRGRGRARRPRSSSGPGSRGAPP